MRTYELLMIVNPELSDDDRTSLLTQVTSEFESAAVKITKQDDWWVKDLAYSIKSSRKGYYILFTLESEQGVFFHATNAFNIQKDIWRFMFTKIA